MSIVSPPDLQLHSDFRISPGGLLIAGPDGAALLHALDAKFRAAALSSGAEEYIFPTLIPEDALSRAEYFQSFPDYASRVSVRQHDRYFLSPAACYHCYELLADSALAEAKVITCCSRCFRGDAPDHSHLWEFTMREIVCLGDSEFVREQRERWMQIIRRWAEELGLQPELAQASDPFFGSGTRGKKLLQQLKQLKYELRVKTPGGGMPIASFNLHEQFFTHRFGITVTNGILAYSGCIAFGLERWALVLAAQHGANAALKRVEKLS